jgi:hypothetical protein
MAISPSPLDKRQVRVRRGKLLRVDMRGQGLCKLNVTPGAQHMNRVSVHMQWCTRSRLLEDVVNIVN